MATKVVVGNSHSCALLTSNNVKCWGYNAYGQLGQADNNSRGANVGDMGINLAQIDLGAGRTASDIVAGANFVCALLDNVTVKCWGEGNYGILGQESGNHRGDNASEMGDNLPAIDFGAGRTVLTIAAGDYHTCVILDNNQMKCWGYNSYGQLGLGDTSHRGLNVGDMGDNLAALDLGVGRTVAIMSLGSNHTCVILDDNSMKCFGQDNLGQLGRMDNSLNLGDEANEMGDNLLAIDFGTGRSAVKIATGASHSCAILDNNTLKCWGYNFGRLGLEGQIGGVALGDYAGEMGDALPSVDLGSGRYPIDIVLGRDHSCAILDDNSLKCWGANGSGQLGQGNQLTLGNDVGEMGDNLTAVAITSGLDHICALLDDATVKCWGPNGWGELGIGDTTRRGATVGDMGDNLPAIDI